MFLYFPILSPWMNHDESSSGESSCFLQFVDSRSKLGWYACTVEDVFLYICQVSSSQSSSCFSFGGNGWTALVPPPSGCVWEKGDEKPTLPGIDPWRTYPVSGSPGKPFWIFLEIGVPFKMSRWKVWLSPIFLCQLRGSGT